MYVDGWNMHGSMRDAHIRAYGWCDFEILVREKTGYKDADIRVKFFTASDYHKEKIVDKQDRWWKALKLKGWDVVCEGEFRRPGTKWHEKMTDVALASHLIADCSHFESDPERNGEYRWKPGYDMAVLLTQDADFVPAVRIVSEAPYNRSVHVLLPGSGTRAQENAFDFWSEQFPRRSVVVQKLTMKDFAKALLPQFVEGPGGEVVECHQEWMYRGKPRR
jgi:hypothetical protein